MMLKSTNRARILAAALSAYDSDSTEIYPDAEISRSDDRGFWIEARVYVSACDVPALPKSKE